MGGGGPDVVFNALHGKYGEDGLHPGRAGSAGPCPTTHSGVLASAIAMEQADGRATVFTSLGMRVAEGRGDRTPVRLPGAIPCREPYVVKPIDQGFPGIGRCTSCAEGDNLAAVEARGGKVSVIASLVEKFVPGRETHRRGDGRQADLPSPSCAPRHPAFYDYEAKYNRRASLSISCRPADPGRGPTNWPRIGR